MITTLPNELLLAIFGEFHLTTIVLASGVCRKWRDLLLVANIHPTRRALLNVFKKLIKEPWFLESRPWVLGNLSPFNRRAYVDALLEQHDYLPEEFKIWILEWPEKAAFGGIWPGLPHEIRDVAGPKVSVPWQKWNFLDASKPIVWTINHINEDGVDVNTGDEKDYLVEPLPGLPINLEEINEGQATWLLLDKGRYRDQTIRTFSSEDEFLSIDINFNVVLWKSWIDFLKNRLREVTSWYDFATEHKMAFLPLYTAPRPISSIPWVDCSHTPFTRPVRQ
ncbi:hypothetical protein ONZ45_g14419 [Pleurotus djamor]|nr:hypothetical protein ONZ45_g14419 [Pleurotus djamor]